MTPLMQTCNMAEKHTVNIPHGNILDFIEFCPICRGLASLLSDSGSGIWNYHAFYITESWQIY